MSNQNSEALNELQNLTRHLFTQLSSDAQGRQSLRDFCEATLRHLAGFQSAPEVQQVTSLPFALPSQPQVQHSTLSALLPASTVEDRLVDLKRQLEEAISCLQRGMSSPSDKDARSRRAELIERCLKNLHLALTVLGGHVDRFGVIPKNMLLLVAEAQSAVRALNTHEREQTAAFHLLLDIASEQGVYLERFMRLSDLADPERHADLRRRLEKQLQSSAASNKKTRTPVEKATPRPVLEGHVLEARKLLKGKTLLLVGGVMKPGHLEALREGLHCTVNWLPTEVSSNFAEVAARVGREKADVVLVLVRFVRHAAMMVKDTTESPVVMVSGGYSLSSVAHHIIEQASVRLSKSA